MLLCPRNPPGKNTGVGCHALLGEIFLTQGSNHILGDSRDPRSPTLQADSLPSEPPGECSIICPKSQSFFFVFCFSPIIFISGRLITLQYCSGFCHTLIWISHGFTCVAHPEPPSLPIPSLWVIPMHQPRALVSWIKPGLAICFTLDNIHVYL